MPSAATPAILDVRNFGGEHRDEVHFKASGPPADLVKVAEQVRRVVMHARCHAALKFVRSVISGEPAHPNRGAPPSSQHVPAAVANHDCALNLDAEPLGRGNEQIWFWFGIGNLWHASPGHGLA